MPKRDSSSSGGGDRQKPLPLGAVGHERHHRALLGSDDDGKPPLVVVQPEEADSAEVESDDFQAALAKLRGKEVLLAAKQHAASLLQGVPDDDK